MTEEPKPYSPSMVGRSQINFTLHVHLDDGTVKDIPCVATPTAVTTKEQDDDHLGS